MGFKLKDRDFVLIMFSSMVSAAVSKFYEKMLLDFKPFPPPHPSMKSVFELINFGIFFTIFFLLTMLIVSIFYIGFSVIIENDTESEEEKFV